MKSVLLAFPNGPGCTVKFNIFQETRQGARHTNQDRIGYLYTKESAIFIVCDGMGGHHKGEVAAEFIVHYLAKAFRAIARPSIKDPARFLEQYTKAAHDALLSYAQKEGMHEVPRTTCVAAIVQEGFVYWINVGDSRLYLIRDGVVCARTVDHSHVQTLIDSGEITEEQAATHPDRNKIYNCLGQPNRPRIDVQRGIRLLTDDVLLLATDGLWGPLSMEHVGRSLFHSGLSIGVPMLMDLSEAITGRECDNLSVVAMHWVAHPLESVSGEGHTEKLSVDDAALDLALFSIRGAILGRQASR